MVVGWMSIHTLDLPANHWLHSWASEASKGVGIIGGGPFRGTKKNGWWPRCNQLAPPLPSFSSASICSLTKAGTLCLLASDSHQERKNKPFSDGCVINAWDIEHSNTRSSRLYVCPTKDKEGASFSFTLWKGTEHSTTTRLSLKEKVVVIIVRQ